MFLVLVLEFNHEAAVSASCYYFLVGQHAIEQFFEGGDLEHPVPDVGALIGIYSLLYTKRLELLQREVLNPIVIFFDAILLTEPLSAAELRKLVDVSEGRKCIVMENDSLVVFRQHDINFSKVRALHTRHHTLDCVLGQQGTQSPMSNHIRSVRFVEVIHRNYQFNGVKLKASEIIGPTSFLRQL